MGNDGRVTSAHTRPQAVLFDFHQTLVGHSSGADRLDVSWARLGRDADPRAAWGAEDHGDRLDALAQVWSRARVRDPEMSWDLSPEAHRRAFTSVLTDGGFDIELAQALYEDLPAQWTPYDDALPVLHELRRRGVRLAVLSNIGIDIRPRLRALGVLDLVDAVVLSYEVGVVKPDPRIFEHTLAAVDVSAAAALMVGDTWDVDGGAAAIGVRTLILPPTAGPTRGLDLVLRICS